MPQTTTQILVTSEAGDKLAPMEKVTLHDRENRPAETLWLLERLGDKAVFTGADETVASYREFTQHYPEPGWVEHDAEELWRVTLGVVEAALRDGGVCASDLRAVGITNQRETAVVWERSSGRPIHRAVVWQSRQTADICSRVSTRIGSIRACCSGVMPCFSAASMIAVPWASSAQT